MPTVLVVAVAWGRAVLETSRSMAMVALAAKAPQLQPPQQQPERVPKDHTVVLQSQYKAPLQRLRVMPVVSVEPEVAVLQQLALHLAPQVVKVVTAAL